MHITDLYLLYLVICFLTQEDCGHLLKDHADVIESGRCSAALDDLQDTHRVVQ